MHVYVFCSSLVMWQKRCSNWIFLIILYITITAHCIITICSTNKQYYQFCNDCIVLTPLLNCEKFIYYIPNLCNILKQYLQPLQYQRLHYIKSILSTFIILMNYKPSQYLYCVLLQPSDIHCLVLSRKHVGSRWTSFHSPHSSVVCVGTPSIW